METKIKLLALLCILNASLSFADDAVTSADDAVVFIETIDRIDTIVPFDQKLVLSLSGKYNIGIFQQQASSYRTDKPWDIGFGIRYKNLAARAYIPITLKSDSFDIAVNFYLKEMYYEAFVKRYTNFYLKNDNETGEHKNTGLDIMSSGIMAGWIHNYKNHSLRSVFTLSEKQTVSSGSFLYGLGVFYTSILFNSSTNHLPQNENMTRYNERQHIVYFGPTAGYSYTWKLPHDMFLNVGINAGANLGVPINNTSILFIPQINPKITFGHHNASWSINAVMGCNTSILLWDNDNFDILVPATMSVTFSKRF
ncbi:MAG: hypothetical protein Ta2B_03970 [Termitinemataceae bacterium]|nr:MAG: hypothetical protein Ta2B_03970 [Termitinemataceae bacterium]